MGHLVTLVSSTLARKKTFLAHVKVEAFETSVSTEGIHSEVHSDIEYLPKSQDWILFTYVTFCLMLRSLSRCKPAIKEGNEKMKKCPNYLFIIMAHMAGFSWHERISSLRCCEALATSFITLPSTSTFRFIHGLILGKLVQITGLQGNYFTIKSLMMNKADGVNFLVPWDVGLPVQDWQPHHGLRLLLHPAQEVQGLNELVAPRLLKAGPHTGLHVGAAKGLDLAQHPGNLEKW